MWNRRNLLATTVGALVTMVGSRSGMKASSAPRNEECDVFVQASKAATVYSDVAMVNLNWLMMQAQIPPQLSKFDTPRMATALRSSNSSEILHYVLYSAGVDKKLAPISLQMLWSIHSNIVFVNAEADRSPPPAKWDDLKERYQSILVDSRFLAEVFAYAASVCESGLGGQVVQLLRSGESLSSPNNSALLELSVRHKANVQLVGEKLRSKFPDSKLVANHVAAFVPVHLPVWTTVKDHPGARVINDVWFPKEYAEPIIKSLTEEQSKATRR